jgi:hypothetical protein
MIYTLNLLNILGAWLAEPTDETINKHLASISKVRFISNFYMLLHPVFAQQFCKTTKYSYFFKENSFDYQKNMFPPAERCTIGSHLVCCPPT